MTTTITSPLIKSFVEATNNHDAKALAALFDADSVVIDDSTEYRGQDAISRWIQDHQITPRITLTVTHFDGSVPVLTANADGDFPGGPLSFRFHFTVGDNIDRLEVTPAT